MAVTISILLSLYLVPSFVALFRHHSNISGVVLVNILAGWTVVGWIGALIMACLPGPERSPVFDTRTGERLAPPR